MSPESNVLAQSLASAEAIAVRLRRSIAESNGLLPVESADLAGLTNRQQDIIDLLLKRWEQLQDTMSNRVLRALLAAAGDDVSIYSARSAADRGETLGAIGNADAFFERHQLRNRLAHEYPEGDIRRAGRINQAFASAPALLADLELSRRCAANLGRPGDLS